MSFQILQLLHIQTIFSLLGISTFMWITHDGLTKLFCQLQICLASNSSSSAQPTLVEKHWSSSWPTVDISDLVVSPTSALSDHSLLTFQVVVSCPCDDHQATFSCRCITPATTTAMAGKLPLSLAPLCNYRSSIDVLWSALLMNSTISCQWIGSVTATWHDNLFF